MATDPCTSLSMVHDHSALRPASGSSMPPVEEADDEIENLVRLTSEGLSMGPSIVTDLVDSYVLISSKLLHLGLYDCSLRDISMQTNNDTARKNSIRSAAATNPSTRSAPRDETDVKERGVPGFPDFPDFWVGAASACRHDNLRGSTTKTKKVNSSTNNSPPASRQHPSSPPLQRKPVNIYGIKSAFTKMIKSSKVIKKAKRDERKSRRIAKIAQLKERRRRKIDMGEICRGMGLIKCD